MKCGDSEELKRTANLSFRLQHWGWLSHSEFREELCFSTDPNADSSTNCSRARGRVNVQNAPRSAEKVLIALCFFFFYSIWWVEGGGGVEEAWDASSHLQLVRRRKKGGEERRKNNGRATGKWKKYCIHSLACNEKAWGKAGELARAKLTPTGLNLVLHS